MRIAGSVDRYDLTKGSILSKFVRLAIPTTSVQLIQMAYGLANTFWLGKLSSDAVAASGPVTIYMWLSMALQCYGNKGVEIGVSQSLGRRDNEAARGFLQSSLSLSLGLGLLVGAGFLFGRHFLIGIYNIGEEAVIRSAVGYLAPMAFSVPFAYVSTTAMSALIASGNSSLPFTVNLVCAALNAALDPLLILVAGLGIEGAAVATVFCQALACALLLIALRRYRHEAFAGMRMWRFPRAVHLSGIARWGTPVAFETFCFTFFLIIISRIVAAFGSDALAVQRLGSQVDSFSYLVSAGVASALTAFIGQNYGAAQFGRIRRGYLTATRIMLVWGMLVTLNLLICNRFIFMLFIPENPAVIDMGARYLRIFALCQMAACLEGVGVSVFRGFGRTLCPAAISVATNLLRVFLAWYLSRGGLAQDGIWWAISVTAFLRGMSLYLSSLFFLRRAMKAGAPLPPDSGGGSGEAL
jgi:putative MATE family efflux protein